MCTLFSLLFCALKEEKKKEKSKMAFETLPEKLFFLFTSSCCKTAIFVYRFDRSEIADREEKRRSVEKVAKCNKNN
jgi:hypothetical protein